MTAPELEQWTGTPASTWRYWAFVDKERSPEGQLGPPSFKIGRRRVWKRAAVEQWLRNQELASA